MRSQAPPLSQPGPSPRAGPLSAVVARKHEAVVDYIGRFDGAITAFSGGVDSSLVAYLAHRVLGARALAVTSASASLNRDDLALTRRLAREWGMRHRIIETRELDNPDYRANPTDRCYFCKTTLYTDLDRVAAESGIPTVFNGTNADDQGDHRPGLLAADEHRVLAPLAACGFGKAEVRELARHLGLPNHDKPQAACLSSRVPYGTSISADVLGRIEAAEKFLRDELGLRQLRVRHHQAIARIEVPPEDLPRVLAHREAIDARLRELGYHYVTVDLRGFRSGSMNETLGRNS